MRRDSISWVLWVNYLLRPSQGAKGDGPGPGKRVSYGAATELEVRLAQKISKAIPSMEFCTAVSSGTEAAETSALRVARGFTGREQSHKIQGWTMAPPTASWSRRR